MISILSLITSVKDYLEVVHKFIEYDSVTINYTELGSLLTFFLISMKNSLFEFFSFSWLLKQNIFSPLWGEGASLPIIIPEISSAMISEISVFSSPLGGRGYLDNTLNFMDTAVSYGTSGNSFGFNGIISCLEKLTIGLINSFFLFLPTSTAHIITLRRFVMQGLDAGYMAGLGTIAGNVFWLASVILGFRFFVIPWLSLDVFRYLLGFILLVKYMWDSYNERKPSVGTPGSLGERATTGLSSSGSMSTATSARKIFILNFLLALTEQTSIYPFISNISINPEVSILETFQVGSPVLSVGAESSNGILFISIHLAYLLGITLGSLSLLHLSCWFWENPAFKIYMWVISSFKVSTSFYYKVLNFGFLYLTMLSAICSIPYYGLDYTITNPLGYVSDDRIIQDKVVLETSFLGTKASDRNTRRNRGRHGRRERWKRRIRKYRTFDASLYDQGIYDLFTIEDLNYGFDRFWLRRKLRNHRVRFRFFPGPWMRSFKKQLAKPRLESYTGPRIEFFRILFEQVYHPSFHSYIKTNPTKSSKGFETGLQTTSRLALAKQPLQGEANRKVAKATEGDSLYLNNSLSSIAKPSLGVGTQTVASSSLERSKGKMSTEATSKSTLRKFIRKFDNRVNTFSTQLPIIAESQLNSASYWRKPASGLTASYPGGEDMLGQAASSQVKFNNFYLNALLSKKQKKTISVLDYLDQQEKTEPIKGLLNIGGKHSSSSIYSPVPLGSAKAWADQGLKDNGKKDLQILQYRSLLTKSAIEKKNSAVSSWPKGDKSQQSKNPNNLKDSLMLLHPLKFYLQKEAGFKRKLRYYSPSIYRKFSVENNAPYFRVMMKRYFYNYKPSLRWERTMKVASLRKARRKTTRIPRKLQNSNLNTEMNLPTSSITLESYPALTVRNQSDGQKSNFFLPIPLEKNSLNAPLGGGGAKASYNYSVVSKRANRYRYQIYKDVLQHWYYSPFNRILLKLDVDSFIRRQPNSHFLTAKEENLLHLRRFLLSEHYNTLRWYTNMEHYRSMKTQLNGGTKSFSSRMYNQQFSGTFKKIRHLFAITPSMTNMTTLDFVPFVASGSTDLGKSSIQSTKEDSKGFKLPLNLTGTQIKAKNASPSGDKSYLQPNVLKFDQPLYNEYTNTSSNPLFNPLIIHEELLPEFVDNINSPLTSPSPFGKQERGAVMKNNLLSSDGVLTTKGEDLLSQSQNMVRQYLVQTRSVRENYIRKLLNENNYSELTQFIYKGQKTRGTEPVTNQKLLNNQEKDYLLVPFTETFTPDSLNSPSSSPSYGFSVSSPLLTGGTRRKENDGSLQTQNMYFTYLKNWKRHVASSGDQESLKNYLTRRLDKREKRKQKKEKQLLTKLQRLENWFELRPFSSRSDYKTSLSLLSEKGQESLPPSNTFGVPLQQEATKGANNILTSGLQKSILDGMFILNDSKDGNIKLDSVINSSKTSSGINQNEKNLWKVLLLTKIRSKDPTSNVAYLPSSYSTKEGDKIVDGGLGKLEQNKTNTSTMIAGKLPFVRLQDISLRFNDIKYAQNLKLVNNLKTSIEATRKYIKTPRSSKVTPVIITQGTKKIQLYNSFKNQINTFHNICLRSATIAQLTLINLLKQTPQSLTKVFTPISSSLFSKATPLTESYRENGGGSKTTKSLKDWRKKERVLAKQKRSRKELKLLNKKIESRPYGETYVDLSQREEIELALQVPLRQKREINQNNPVISAPLLWGDGQSPKKGGAREEVYTFKRKRSPQRRSRVRRNRGVFKKRSLSDSLRKDFLQFYNEKDPTLKSQYYQKFSPFFFLDSAKGKEALPQGSVQEKEETKLSRLPFPEEKEGNKQRKSKQRKERYWKQKRSKYAQKRRKYRKRRRYTIVKIRTLNKQFKRIKNQIEIQNWWWKRFIPSIQASNEALWQIEKDKLIQQKLSQLSTSEILQRDSLNSSNFDILQIGNTDFKPLAVPQAIRLKKQITESKQLNNTLLFSNSEKDIANSNSFLSEQNDNQNQNQKFNVVNKLYESLFISSSYGQGSLSTESQVINPNNNFNTIPFMVPNTNLPFYAGWDESLRKLIITNRMLSRKEASFSLLGASPNSLPAANVSSLEEEGLLNKQSSLITEPYSLLSQGKAEFTAAPLQGMNAATTLYWQIPFTTYDPDQFFALGMDGFSPIGWRKFLFRHSILKTWLANTPSLASNEGLQTGIYTAKAPFVPSSARSQIGGERSAKEVRGSFATTHPLIVKTRYNLLTDFSLLSLNTQSQKQEAAILSQNKTDVAQSLFGTVKISSDKARSNMNFVNAPSGDLLKGDSKKNSFAVSRRLKKRYRRVKKHPRTPVWFPSGPLLNQVLPVHYIYVFYKRSRLPRDRYLKRRLMNVKDLNSASSLLPTAGSQILSPSFGSEATLPAGFDGPQNYDFTLRKRLKPKRKYHLKRDYYASNVVIPRRFKFMSISSDSLQKTVIQRWRPLSSLKIHKPISEVVKEQQLLRRSTQQKQRSSKQQQPSMRVKQLRRRVQRQILRSVWRYRPRAGGFVWPGDYLKLELIKAPKLQPNTKLNDAKQSTIETLDTNLLDSSYGQTQGFSSPPGRRGEGQQKRKKKRTLVEWQIQPKKYLNEKHNIRVLKKKLLKSFVRPDTNEISNARSIDSNLINLNVLRNLV